jgi:pyruvate dehydrogenase E1 component alpha subunit
MFHARLFENAVAQLWREGLISGEMHSGAGEEAIAAGIVSQLNDNDAMALDHRATPPLLMRGVDPVLIMSEFLGSSNGLCGGRGGHMHLYSKEHLAASSGIVGASGPGAAGFALSAQMLRPGTIATAFFGEAAINQGMLMESFNLARVWNLPVLFVCKDDNWAITTRSNTTSAASPTERAKGFDLPVFKVDGNDVEAVYSCAETAVQKARQGKGPSFIHATCSHVEGHMLDLQLVRAGRGPTKEIPRIALQMVKAALSPRGTSVIQRVKAVLATTQMILASARDHKILADDPLLLAREKLTHDMVQLETLETEVSKKIEDTVRSALEGN